MTYLAVVGTAPSLKSPHLVRHCTLHFIIFPLHPVNTKMSAYTIHVTGLAPETTEEKLHDFFSFCGKLVAVKKEGNTAEITFEKLSAMRTSLCVHHLVRLHLPSDDS